MLIRGTDESETRKLTIVGAILVLLCVVVAAVALVFKPFQGRANDLMSVVIDTPYVGQGVSIGTYVVMNGVRVGEVKAVTSLPDGGVRLNADLQTAPVTGLTDKFDIDFRPVNYFGVTGVNVIKGAGGQPIHDGMRINLVPKGNFTLQALLYRVGELSAGVITPQLIQVIDKGTRYLDGLDPLIETMVIVGNAVAGVQNVSTAQLIANTTQMALPLPGFIGSVTQAGRMYINDNLNYMNTGLRDYSDKFWEARGVPTFDEAVHIFGDIGTLLKTHVGDLLPIVNTIKPLTDVVPVLVKSDDFASTLVELRSRFEKMYAGSADQRALQVRIVLDELPGVAAPLGAMGGPR